MRLPLLAVLGLASLAACRSSTPTITGETEPAAAAPSASSAPSSVPDVDAASYAPPTDTVAAAQRIAGSILVGGHAIATLRDLSALGPRLTGSDGLARAADWAVAKFREDGVTKVAIEPFSIAHTWTRHPSVVRAVAPEEHVLTSEALGWTPATPADGIRAEVVQVKNLSETGLDALGDRLRGKIALLDRGVRKTLPKKEDASVTWKRLKEHGAVAVGYVGSRDNDVLSAFTPADRTSLVAPLPGFAVGKEDAAWLEERLAKGPVTVLFTNDSVLGGPAQVPDVVAEIPGREKPDEWVLVCAHFDSWDFATGTQDNGSGAVAVMEAARAIASLGVAPRRSIRFALWGGEEEGLIGSYAYAQSHSRELDGLVYVVNTDHGAGAPTGWNLGGRVDAAPAFTAFQTPLLGGLGATAVTTPAGCDTDDCTFFLEGVPTANLEVDTSHYDEIHHTPGDTIDKVAEGPFSSGVAVVAVTAYALAERSGRLAPRLAHAAVAKNLAKADLVDELVSGGYWK